MTARQNKSPRQRAEEQLGVADRKVKKLTLQETKLRGQLSTLEADLEAAKRRREYLTQNPDLPKKPEPAGAKGDPVTT